MPKAKKDADTLAFAERLVALLESRGQARRGAGAYLHRRYGVATVTANAWLNGEHRMAIDLARKIAEDHGATFDELYFGTSTPTKGRPRDDTSLVPENVYPAADQVSVALFNARGSMGDGIPVPESDIILGNIGLSAEWIRNTLPKITSPRNLRFIEGKGSSMEPTFSDGDILLVDTGVTSVTIDAIYVLSGHSRLFIKRVRQTINGPFEISSDNPVVKTSDTLNGDHEITVHGRVVWAWNGKRL